MRQRPQQLSKEGRRQRRPDLRRPGRAVHDLCEPGCATDRSRAARTDESYLSRFVVGASAPQSAPYEQLGDIKEGKTLSSPPIPTGSILVTNTMICEASRFVGGQTGIIYSADGRIAGNIDRFFDLCSLIEACVLHKHLVTLDGTLLGSMNDYDSLSLRALLKKEGILLERTVPFNPSKIQRKLVTVVGSERVFSRIDTRGMSIYVVDMLPEVFPDDVHRQEPANFPGPDRFKFFMAVNHPASKPTLIACPDVFSFFRTDNFEEFLRGTGDYGRGAYVLRTFLYYGAATENRLSFFPDYPRIPFFDSLVTYIHNSVIMSAYKLFADKLQCEAEDFLKDASPIGLPIPPFASILLKRCKSPADIGSELLALREEYAELRENLIQLDENRASCTNIKERNAARAKVEAIFEAASKKFHRSGYSTFKSITEFAEDVAKPLYNPYDPSSYSSALLMKPVEWLRNWWYRRPLAQFFDLVKEFRLIPEYDKLVKKVFGIEFNEQEIASFKDTQATLGTMFR